ncbi:MAG: hypothetical protein BAJALOKI2v1_650021 [Promethearchaeota archaeon]|nr:MAG: hypothetical protein BAJALOKI2v1_650021 [Candidatus Lokiarchaeota archaeon]
MKIKKEKVKLKKITIDLVRCPITDLYLQDLYCKKCGNFVSNDMNFLECKYEKTIYRKSSPNKKGSKDLLLKELNPNQKQGSSSELISRIKTSSKRNPSSSEARNDFSHRLASRKAQGNKKISKEQTIIQELTQKFKKDTLTENFNTY